MSKHSLCVFYVKEQRNIFVNIFNIEHFFCTSPLFTSLFHFNSILIFIIFFDYYFGQLQKLPKKATKLTLVVALHEYRMPFMNLWQQQQITKRNKKEIIIITIKDCVSVNVN